MGYYSPADLVLALNLAIAAKYTALGLVIAPPTFSYSGFKYTLTNPAAGSILLSVWSSNPVYTQSSISSASTSSGSSAFVISSGATGYRAGSYILASGFANATYNGSFLVTAVIGNTIYGTSQGATPTGTALTGTVSQTTIQTPKQWRDSASLWKTMGFQYEQTDGANNYLGTSASMTGLVTLTAYTDFVDITSSKLNLYSDVKDGSSASGGTDPVICRLFGNNEISYNPDQAWTPFIIHRQFPLPKTIQWNPESTIDWFDIQVRDMYGLPVPTPAFRWTTSFGALDSASYPDFQITFQASEN